MSGGLADIQRGIERGAGMEPGALGKVSPYEPKPRYCLVSDESGHDYAIPVERKPEWLVWFDLDAFKDVPDWALRIDGNFTFTDPQNP